LGSVAAGRHVGYLQMVLSVSGVLITSGFGLHFLIWYSAHRAEFEGDNSMEGVSQLLHQLRMPLLGIGLFALAWFWALGTSIDILRAAKLKVGGKPPPLIPPANH
jgi:hypothetical protein